MTLAKAEGPRIPPEPVVKMAGEVRVEEIQAILGEGMGYRGSFPIQVLEYPAIDVSIVFRFQGIDLPIRWTVLSIKGKEVMKLEDTAVVLDMDNGWVKFIKPVQEEKLGNKAIGIALSTRKKLVYYSDTRVESVPRGSSLTYEVQAANLATEQFKKRAV